MKRLILAAAVTLTAISAADARPRHHSRHHGDANGNGVTFLSHPAGCPPTRFCGCGAGKALGQSGWNYNLASNWPKHYHGPVQVAYWGYGHVAIIREMRGKGKALMEDYNSGGHLSRLHVRSLAGARIIGG